MTYQTPLLKLSLKGVEDVEIIKIGVIVVVIEAINIEEEVITGVEVVVIITIGVDIKIIATIREDGTLLSLRKINPEKINILTI